MLHKNREPQHLYIVEGYEYLDTRVGYFSDCDSRYYHRSEEHYKISEAATLQV